VEKTVEVKPRRAGRRVKPKPEPQKEADREDIPEEEEVEAVDWEPVEDEPKEPVKPKQGKKKSASAVNWIDDDEDETGKRSNTDENNIDEWWSEND
jgi:hypothetical protein